MSDQEHDTNDPIDDPVDAVVVEYASPAQLESDSLPFNAPETQQRLVEPEPFQIREVIAIALIVFFADFVVWRGEGFAGYAAWFAIAPVLLWLGSRQKISLPGVAIVSAMLAALSLKLIWSGSWLAVACGFGLLVLFAMSVSGQVPFVGEAIIFLCQSVGAGVVALQNWIRPVFGIGMPVSRVPWLNVLLPAAALVVFSMIFTFANPDFLKYISTHAEELILGIRDWLLSFSPGEVVFWIATAWISLGLMKPLSRTFGEQFLPKSLASDASDEDVRTKIYPAIRNTLLTVIGLFAVYLVFEFRTLWFREIPDGFYYAGYAHEGAAWLTVALGLATIMLSMVFRGRILRDARIPNLKKLAWIWSAQNFFLAIAVYNRLMIYVNFNGMTRMRVIGFLGITCVVIGFIVVLVKISRRRSFGWLFQRQVATVAMAVFVYAMLPVDWIVQSHNTRQVLAGDLAPSVQMTEHPIDDHGMLALIPLTNCEDVTIREGVRAMLAEREISIQSVLQRQEKKGWTARQLLDRSAEANLTEASTDWKKYRDNATARAEAIKAFRDYAYQWY